MVRAPGCGPGGRGFESPRSPQNLFKTRDYSIPRKGSCHCPAPGGVMGNICSPGFEGGEQRMQRALRGGSAPLLESESSGRGFRIPSFTPESSQKNEKGLKNQMDSEGEKVLCPNCMEQNLPETDFCQKCGIPMTASSTIDPLKRIYSQGWLFRKTASGRIPRIAFWGTWLIFLPTILLMLLIVLRSSRMFARAGIPVVLLPVYCFFLYRVSKNYIYHRRRLRKAD